MKIYISAFIGALFLMLIMSIFVEGLVWIILQFFHASKSVILTTEGVILMPLLAVFIFVFRSALATERELAEGLY